MTIKRKETEQGLDAGEKININAILILKFEKIDQLKEYMKNTV